MKSLVKENNRLAVSETSTASSPVTNAPDPRRWKALALLSLAQFMVILDTSIIAATFITTT